MTSEGKTEPNPRKLRSCIPRRLQILLIGVALLVLSSAGLCLLAAFRILSLTPEGFMIWLSALPELGKLWLLMLCGPFAGLTDPSDPSQWTTIGAINLLFIFAHPIWPNRITAVITLLAFAPWLFWGFAVEHLAEYRKNPNNHNEGTGEEPHVAH